MSIRSALAAAWDTVAVWHMSHRTKDRDNIIKDAEKALKEKKVPLALDNALALMLHWEKHQEIVPVVRKVFAAAVDGTAEQRERAWETALGLLAARDAASPFGQMMIAALQDLSLKAEETGDYDRAGQIALKAAAYIDAAARSRALAAGTRPEFGDAEQGAVRRFLTMATDSLKRNDVDRAVNQLCWAAEAASRAAKYGGEAAQALQAEAAGRLKGFADSPPQGWSDEDRQFIREIVDLYTPKESSAPGVCPLGHGGPAPAS